MNDNGLSPRPKGTRAVVALGSNLGCRRKTLLSAVSYLTAHPNITVHKISPLVLSQPVGVSRDGTSVDVDGQPPYLNMVVELEAALGPTQLLKATQKIENGHGRVRTHRWSCRTLDIDIITYGNARMETADLILPHPRAWERAFVLYPWALMDPGSRLGPELTRNLAARASDYASLRPVTENFIDDFVDPRPPALFSPSFGGDRGT